MTHLIWSWSLDELASLYPAHANFIEWLKRGNVIWS